MKYVLTLAASMLILFSATALSNVTGGYVFEQHAAYSGTQPDSYWAPAVGSGTGQLLGKPDHLMDDNGDGTQNWFYRFDDAGTEFDQSVDIESHSNLSFIDTGWATIEAWVRLDDIITNSKTRGIIIGNVDGADTGWRLGLRCSSSAGKYAVEFQQRDNEDAETAFKGTLHYLSPYEIEYSSTEWVHVAFVKYAAEYDPAHAPGAISINHDIYVNGQEVSHGVRTLAASSLSDFYCPPSDPQLGTFRNDMNFEGDIGVVRIYDRLLTETEIQQNFDAGFAVPEPATLMLISLGVISLKRK